MESPEPYILSNEDFRDKLIEFFRTHLKDCANDRFWDGGKVKTLIRQSREKFQDYMQADDFADIYIEVLFSLFEIVPVIERDVVRDALEDFLLRKIKLCNSQQVLPHVLPMRYPRSLDVPYYIDPFTRKKYSTDNIYSPPLLLDFEVTQRLLRYGGGIGFNYYQMYSSLISVVKCLSNSLTSSTFCVVFQKVCLAYPNNDKKKRLYFVLLALYVTLQKRTAQLFPGCSSSIRSLKLVFKSTKQPFITVTDVHRFLDLFLPAEDKEIKIKEFCAEFAKEFTKDSDYLKPRSLKHLCRWKVRDSMAKAKKLPHGVWKLDIPRQLKNFLLLQKTPEEFYPKHVFELSK